MQYDNLGKIGSTQAKQAITKTKKLESGNKVLKVSARSK
jgi:hypothetical protein